MLYDCTVNRSRIRFYGREGRFNNFLNITEEVIDNIKQELQTFFNNIESDKLNYYQRYEKVYDFLGSPIAATKFKTFDEQVLFLIFALDPDLLYLKTYKDTCTISLREVEAADNKSKKLLEAQRSEQKHIFTRNIRDAFGICDSKILRYEALYFEHIIKPETYTTKVTGDAATVFFKFASFVRSFERITDERFEELKAIVDDYKELVPNINNLHVLAYNILYKRRGFKTLNIRERYALFIYIIDPELKVLKIYEEESTMNEIRRRCIEEFGYFNEVLIRLEMLYHQRFCPNKKISLWSDERMLLWKKD